MIAQDLDLIFAKSFGGNSFDSSYSIHNDNFGNIYVCGTFSQTVNFETTSGIVTYESYGNPNFSDAFVAKFDSIGNMTWVKRIGGGNVDFALDVKTDALGNVFVLGTFKGTTDFDPGPNSTTHQSFQQKPFLVKLDSEGNFNWVNVNIGVSSGAIAIDSDNDVLLSGIFTGTMSYNSETGSTETITSSGSGQGQGIFLAKINGNTSEFMFLKAFKDHVSPSYMSVNTLIIDNQDNIHITGIFNGNVDFDPNAGVHEINHGINQVTMNAVFILKLTNNGEFLWVKSILAYPPPISPAGGELYSKDMALDSNGNLYVVGFFRGTADFNPEVEVYELTSVNYNRDAYILKLDINGEFLWAKRFGNSMIESIVIDGEDNVYTAGVFAGSINFNTDEGQDIFMLTSAGFDYLDIFIHKLNSDGSFMFANRIGGLRNDIPYSMDISSNSEIIMTGTFYYTVDFNPGEGVFELSSNGYTDIFVTKINSGTLSTPENILNENKIKFYPNPFINKINISSHEKIKHISIYDLNGKLLKHKKAINTTSIDININEKWSNGLYIIKIETDSYYTYQKIIKN